MSAFPVIVDIARSLSFTVDTVNPTLDFTIDFDSFDSAIGQPIGLLLALTYSLADSDQYVLSLDFSQSDSSIWFGIL